MAFNVRRKLIIGMITLKYRLNQFYVSSTLKEQEKAEENAVSNAFISILVISSVKCFQTINIYIYAEAISKLKFGSLFSSLKKNHIAFQHPQNFMNHH